MKINLHTHQEKWVNHTNIFYCLIKDNNFLGRVELTNLYNQYIIEGLYILPEYRNLGLGSYLINLITSNEEYTNPIYLECLKEDNKIIQFYNKLGFIYNSESDEKDLIWMKFNQ